MASLLGTNGADTLTGTASADTISGLAGNDSITGGDGNDVINAGDGADTILGGDGKDQITGGHGSDVMLGGAGTDSFLFNKSQGGYDVVHGTGEVDTIRDFEGAGVTGGDILQFFGYDTASAFITRFDSSQVSTLTYYQIGDKSGVAQVIAFTNMGAGHQGLTSGDYHFY